MSNSIEEDARRYRVLRTNAWHFMVRVRPEDFTFQGGCNAWPAMCCEALDDAIDSWVKHPTYGIPRR